jgi:hypothetical protein
VLILEATPVSPLDIAVLALRLALVLVLYAFLVVVVRAARSSLDEPPTPRTARAAPRSVGPPTNELRLRVLDGGRSGLPSDQVLCLGPDAVLGRAREAAVTLADETVSSQHARLLRVNDTWLLRDLGSTNGTLLNGQPLGGDARLAPGDVLSLGRVRLEVER